MNLKFDKILFLDIETVPQTGDYRSLDTDFQHLWENKFEHIKSRFPVDATPEYGYLNGAGIFAEFGKICCISAGVVFYRNDEMCFRTKSFAGSDERNILSNFSAMLAKSFSGADSNLCGHNIKEFDIPFICRRMLVNGLPIPKMLQIHGKKPWEISFIDTLELWKFGDYKNFTSLKLLTHIFGIPSPKDDIDGSQVAQVFYQERNIERIAAYCEKDVLATAQLLLKLCGKPLIEMKNVECAQKNITNCLLL